MIYRTVRTGLQSLLLTSLCASLSAQYDEAAPEPLRPLQGTVVLGGGGDLPAETFARFESLAGGAAAKLVVIRTSAKGEALQAMVDATTVTVAPGNDTHIRAATAALAKATGVWLVAATASDLVGALRETDVETALQGVLLRGGVVGASGDAAAALSRTRITGGDAHATVGRGLDLVPGVVVVPEYLKPDRNRLLGVLASQPRLVGVAVEAGTVLVLQKRFMDVFGAGSAYACVAANEHMPVRVERIHGDVSPRSQRRAARQRSGDRGRRQRGRRPARGDDQPRPYRPRRLEDLVALSRDAMARTRSRFPAVEPPKPHVAKGTLMIVGGGGSPPGFMDKFMEYAGGKDALLLYIPCTESENANAERTLARWRKAGATNVDFIHTKDRHEADTSAEIHDKLKRAGGLFFGGGRQWNLVDSWQHTEAHRLMQDVLARGGVIAGSSAGSSIQGSYMARGNSLGNVDSMAPGYDTGLGFLTGVAIDQHFSQRRRQPDMTALVNRYPQLLGIGLDEASSIVVRGSVATCFCREGRKVHFYDRRRPVVPGEPDYLLLENGQRFDLVTRKVLK